MVAVVTHTLVDAGDPAFSNPTKPIGSFLGREEAERLAKSEGWAIVEDSGRGYRRVVASPRPRCGSSSWRRSPPSSATASW